MKFEHRIFLLCIIAALLIPFASASTCPTFTAVGDSYVCTSGASNVTKWINPNTTTWVVPPGVTEIEYVVVGGGGSGGGGYFGGGGGAGGFNSSTYPVTPETSITIKIGAGGNSSGLDEVGRRGQNSILDTINVTGGGGGGTYNSPRNGLSGGSGGGGAGNGNSGAAGIGGDADGTDGVNGYDGGNTGVVAVGLEYAAGGGGGATSIGGSGTGSGVDQAGVGGNGNTSSITGAAVVYAAGGGGGTYTNGAAGGSSGVGGHGADIGEPATAGAANTGSGGGGGAHDFTMSGSGATGVVIIKYTPATPPTAMFTMLNATAVTSASTTNITGYLPLTVFFSNNSAGFSPPASSFVWNYTTLSTVQPVTFNQTAYYNTQYAFTDPGNYRIYLNATSPEASAMSTQVSWVNLSVQPQTLNSFAASSTSVIMPNTVTFTSQSYGYPADRWLWNFGDGNTSTSENPVYSYPTPGDYTVSLTSYRSDNATNTNTSTLANYINVTYGQFYVKPDFVGTPTSGAPGLLVSFTDLKVVGNSSAPLTCLWNFGDSVSLTPTSTICGDVQHVYTYGGVYDVNYSVTMWGNTSYEYKQQYIVVSEDKTPSKLNVLYPREVQFACLDTYSNPITNMTVTAVMTETSNDGTNWFSTLFGITADTTPINTTLMTGTTDNEGAVAFPMIATARYTMTFTSVEHGVSAAKTVSPQQLYFVYIFPTTHSIEKPNMADYINGTLYTTDHNATMVNLSMIYTDVGLSTTSLTFYVDYANGTRLYTLSAFANNSLANATYMMPNTKSASYAWGYSAMSSTFGWVNQSSGILLKGATGRVFNLDPCGGYATGWGDTC